MRELGEDPKGDNQEADGNNNQGQENSLAIAPTCLRHIWTIVGRYYVIQVTKIMHHVSHRLIPLLWVTTDGTHHHCGQGWRKAWVTLQDRGRVLRNVLVHDSKDILALKRRMTTEHFIQYHTNSINIRANHTTFAP